MVALGTKAAYAAYNGLGGSPVLYGMVREPSRYGLTGDRIAGVTHRVSVEDQLAHLRLFAPGVRSIGMLLGHDHSVEEIQAASKVAEESGFELHPVRVESGRDVRASFQRLRRKVDALWLLPDRVVVTPENFRYLRDETRRLGLPLLVYSEALGRAGGLMCVAPSLEDVGETLAEMTQSILQGGEIAKMPDRVPERLRVVPNRDTLDAIGLEVDPLMLDFADEVYSEGGRR